MRSHTIILTSLLLNLALIPILNTSGSDLSDKVVIANLDRYSVQLRFGKIRREIKPRKASVLSPKSYPVTIEYWSGNTKAGWVKQTVSRAGNYGFNFTKGKWLLTELKKGKTARSSVRPSPRVVRKKILSQPVRRLPINVDRNRWSPLARVAYAAGKIYQFVRDEQDRDLLRELLIRAREDEDWDRLERWLRDEPIPELYKRDLRDAFDDLARLGDEDWDAIGKADEKDWDTARNDLGDLINESDWDDLAGDFSEIGDDDFWQDNLDVDLSDLDYADDFDFNDIDLEDFDLDDDDQGRAFDLGGLDMAEEFDIGDLGIDDDHFDLGGFDDLNGFDGLGGDNETMDLDLGDFGGGYFGDNDLGDFGGFDDFDFDF